MQPARTVELAVDSEDSTGRSYVEWAPIFAGAVLAVSLSLVLFAFAGGVGLAIASPWPGSGAEPEALSVLSVAWVLFVMIFSSIAGAYVAGRLRNRRLGASAEEVEFRDGVHGLVVWAAGLILAALATMALSFAAAAARAGDNAAPYAEDYATSLLLRRTDEDRDQVRAELGPIERRIQAGQTVPGEDAAYLSSTLADRADIGAAEARARVDAWLTTTRETAAEARRASAITAFLLAATALTAAAAAYFAAGIGGRHRDRHAPFPWTRVRTTA